MERIGVRALQQNASAVLRRVQRGASLEVTEHGRLVALLSPPRRRGMDALQAIGRVDPADGDLLDLDPPPVPRRSVEPPSRRLRRMRRHER